MGRASGSQRATHTSLGGAGYQEAGTGLCSETLRRKEGDRKVELAAQGHSQSPAGCLQRAGLRAHPQLYRDSATNVVSKGPQVELFLGAGSGPG